MDNDKLESLVRKVEKNSDKIDHNSEKIKQNTGALEILRTFKEDSHRFFVMWLITFFALLGAIGYIIYTASDINKISTTATQEVEQDNQEGSNYFIGRDGDIDG